MMAKIHDLFIVELAEVIKGYGNDPYVKDPFRLSEFYRFYELPNIAVSRENFEKMRPIEPERKTVKWIPCSERLPELDEDGYSDKVLVCFANFTGCEICEYRDCDDCHGWYVGDTDDNPEDIGIHVIAWMPLPEPYKEGEQNED